MVSKYWTCRSCLLHIFICLCSSYQSLIGSRSGGWSSSQILLKSISLGLTSSTSLFPPFVPVWFAFVSKLALISLSRGLGGGATYPNLGRWITRKPGKKFQWQHKTWAMTCYDWAALSRINPLWPMVSSHHDTNLKLCTTLKSPVVWDLLAELLVATTWETEYE